MRAGVLVVVLAVVVGATAPAFAATYYVNGGCTNNGNGASPSCAGAPNGIGAFRTIDGCMQSAMTAGDTCSIASFAGAYVEHIDFCDNGGGNKSGTAGAYTTFIGTGASKPILCRDATCLGVRDTPHVSIGSYDAATGRSYSHKCQYITIQGLDIRGAISAQNIALLAGETHHITLTGNEISGVSHLDANETPFFMQDEQRGSGNNVHHLQIDHNRFHDILNSQVCVSGSRLWQTCGSDIDCTGGGSCHTGATYAFIRNFGVAYLTIEYNTFDATTGQGTSSGAFDDKDCPYNNTVRFNYFMAGSNGNEFMRVSNQCLSSNMGGDQIYGNVIVGGGVASLQVSISNTLPWNIHHNTIIEASRGGNNGIHFGNQGGTAFHGVTFMDNIIANNTGITNVLIDTNAWSRLSTDTINYNRYDSDAGWRSNSFGAGDTSYCSSGCSGGTFAGWVAAVQAAGCVGCEANSSAASTPCSFVSGPDTPYHVTGTCTHISSTGGEVGAYGVTSCVGLTCGGAPAAVCGNGIVEGAELCDDQNTTTETVCPYGQPTCTYCRADCGAVLNLTGPYCGDAVINATFGEICDGANLGTDTCAAHGFDAGALTCLACTSVSTAGCFNFPDVTVLRGGKLSGGGIR